MPLVKTLYEPMDFKESSNRGISIPVEKLVMVITGEIIREKPYFVINAYTDEEKKNTLKAEIISILDRGDYYYTGGRDSIISSIFDFMFGYGVLQKYIDDDDISDIDGTAYNEFSITKNGERIPVDVNFGDSDYFETYCKLISIRSGGFLNEDDTHCRTADIERKLRINVSIPPRNVSGPAISIRKHRKKAYVYKDLVNLGMLDEKAKDILSSLGPTDSSMLFSGKGAAGKTTLLRTFLNALPDLERVLVVESDAEIYPQKRFCIEQRTKKPGEGGKPVTLEMLVRDGLTMSLDTYCVGEIVGDEAYSFIKASGSGHRILGTIHANCAEETIGRIVNMAAGGSAGDSVGRIFEAVVSGIDYIVYLRKFKVETILEIKGFEGNQPIYKRVYER